MNMLASALPPVALIAGPTASGKSALALAVAEHANGVVVNADSAQVYRDLRIVSARPTEAEEARAPHRLYGTRDGADACSAADWAADAKREIAAAHAAGRLPVLAGGTGLLLRTLIDGIAAVPDIDPAILQAVRARWSARCAPTGPMPCSYPAASPASPSRWRPRSASTNRGRTNC
jgi:tRNA dimethylallyltransferase